MEENGGRGGGGMKERQEWRERERKEEWREEERSRTR